MFPNYVHALTARIDQRRAGEAAQPEVLVTEIQRPEFEPQYPGKKAGVAVLTCSLALGRQRQRGGSLQVGESQSCERAESG